jgi:hypothetical protein
MTLAARILLTGIAFVAAYYFVYWVPFSLIMSGDRPEWIPFLGSLICAILAGRFVWRTTGSAPSGLFTHIGLGAAIVGGIGFVGGFFGPMLFAPGANQGPMLGLLITGPLGCLLGAVGGALYWLVRGKHEAAR